MMKTRCRAAFRGLWPPSGGIVCAFVSWVILIGANPALAQVTPTNRISLTLSWLAADAQPAPFFTKGYQLTRFIPGNAGFTQDFVQDHSPNPDYKFTYSDLDPDTTYTFRCESVCGSETNSTVETNSEFISLTFSTGAIVPGDDRPPVVSVNHANDVIPVNPPDAGFDMMYAWSSNVTITGTAVDESHLTLQISGDATVQNLTFQGTGGAWVANLNLKNIGTNLISIRATDFFTNNTITNIIVVNLGRTNTAGISPKNLTETYDGWITLEVDGVAGGQPILVEKFLDANGNGVVDAGDLLCQRFSITDGSAFNVAGILFPTVPGDEDDAANGRIFAGINFRAQSEINRMVAGYIVHITDSTGQFSSIALPMRVLPRESPQKIVGEVTAGGLPVAGALVFYSSPPDTNWIGGVVTDGAGHYQIACEPGIYAIAAFKQGYVCNLNWTSQTLVNPGIDAIVNPPLLLADRVIRGTIYDSTAGLGGQQVVAQSPQGWAALTTTDSQGNFELPVLAASFTLLLSSKGLSMAGYLGLKDNPVVNTLTGDVSGLVISLAIPNAVIFGAIIEPTHQPLSGISINALATSLPWSSSSIPSDSSGLYSIGVSAGDWAAGPNPGDLARQGYIGGDWPAVSPTNGQAIYYQYSAMRATAYLSGVVIDDAGTPIKGISVEAADSSNFSISTITDAAGAFRIGVASGLWTLRIKAAGSKAANYTTPFMPFDVVEGVNQSDINLLLYTVTGQISGTIVDALNRPIAATRILATLSNVNTNASYYVIGATDAKGHYSINVSSGLWLLDLPDLDPTVYIIPAPREILVDITSIVADYSIALNAPLSIATTVLANPHPGLNFSQTLLAYGGQAPYNWTLTPASLPLPPSLQLSPDGVLSGVPTKQGAFPFTVLLSDSLGSALEQPFTLLVNTAPPMRLQAMGYGNNGGFLLRATGVSGIKCLIQISENFTNWTTLLNTNSAPDVFVFEDNSLPISKFRFYRLQKGS